MIWGHSSHSLEVVSLMGADARLTEVIAVAQLLAAGRKALCPSDRGTGA